jgi:hypothetical protein
VGTFPIATWASKRVATWARKRVASMKKTKQLFWLVGNTSFPIGKKRIFVGT